MGEGMEDFKKGFRKATGAEADDEKKKKKPEDDEPSAVASLLGDIGGGLAGIAGDAADMLKKAGSKKK